MAGPDSATVSGAGTGGGGGPESVEAELPASGSMDGLLATKEIVVACGPGGVGKTTTAAAAAVMAAVRHGSKVLVLTVDPAKRLADALGPRRDRQHRAPGARRGVPGGRDQAAGPAVGGHARHQGVVGRADPPARARRADPGRDPGQSPVPEHLGPVRPEPRLHRHGAALRDPLRERLRPHRGRHPADPQRPRLPRRPPADGRLLLVPPAPLADRPLPVHAWSTSPPSPSTRSPTGSWAPSSWPTSPSSSSSSSRCTTGSSSGRSRWAGSCRTAAPPSSWCRPSRRCRFGRPSSSPSSSPPASSTWGPSC